MMSLQGQRTMKKNHGYFFEGVEKSTGIVLGLLGQPHLRFFEAPCKK
jgi:hypothetical protein